MIGMDHFSALSALLFSIGLLGVVLNRSNLIGLLMCIELMLLAATIQFIAYGYFLSSVLGQIVVFFVLAVAAAESAVGLAIFILLYRHYASIQTDQFNLLKG